MSQIIDHETGEILSEEDAFQLLDQYRGEAEPRPTWLASISAGYKKADGVPTVSRDGTIHVHGPEEQTVGLRQALASTGNKSLTVAFTSDRISDIIDQHYVLYSQTAVKIWGDEYALTEIVDAKPVIHLAGTPAYDAARIRCKVSTSFYFILARWMGQRVHIWWPDGFGHYRGRTTSHHSAATLAGKIREIQHLTNGRIAGIPLTLQIEYRDVAGPDGTRRKVPVWTLALKPPEMIQLTGDTWRTVISRALAEAASLRALKAPEETLEDAQVEAAERAADDELAEADIQRAQTGVVRCDPLAAERQYFAIAKGTPFADPDGRAELITEISGGLTSSLATFLARGTTADVDRLLVALREALANGAPRPPIQTSHESRPDLPTVAAREEYADLMSEALRVGVDPAPYEIDAHTSGTELEALTQYLQKAIDLKRAEGASGKPAAGKLL